MLEDKKKISANDAIMTMLRMVISDNLPQFYSTVEAYAKGYAFNNPVRANLLHVLKSKPLQLMKLNDLPPNVKNLIAQCEVNEENVFLSDCISSVIDDIILEWDNSDLYEFHNLKVRNKILLFGETGNGKTTIARHIAKRSNLPFVEVKSDIVIDSHLGNTGANIHNIFKQIQEPCVLFWDEVDSIGSKRGSKNESAAASENDRMTNSILVNIEKLRSDVIFIAATNRVDILDTAFLRRFDLKIEIKPPIDIEKDRFAKQLIKHYNIPFEMPNVSQLKSYSEVKDCIVGAARESVLNKIRVTESTNLN